MTRLRRRIKRHLSRVRWALRAPDFYRDSYATRSDGYRARVSFERCYGGRDEEAARQAGWHAGRALALRLQALDMAGRS